MTDTMIPSSDNRVRTDAPQHYITPSLSRDDELHLPGDTHTHIMWLSQCFGTVMLPLSIQRAESLINCSSLILFPSLLSPLSCSPSFAPSPHPFLKSYFACQRHSAHINHSIRGSDINNLFMRLCHQSLPVITHGSTGTWQSWWWRLSS